MQIICQFVYYAVDLTPDRQVVSGRNTGIKIMMWLIFILEYVLSNSINFTNMKYIYWNLRTYFVEVCEKHSVKWEVSPLIALLQAIK